MRRGRRANVSILRPKSIRFRALIGLAVSRSTFNWIVSIYKELIDKINRPINTCAMSTLS